MMNAKIDGARPVSLWAAIGAPMVGIPLMVALLAVTAPAERSRAGDADPTTQVERMEAQPADSGLESGTDCPLGPMRRG